MTWNKSSVQTHKSFCRIYDYMTKCGCHKTLETSVTGFTLFTREKITVQMQTQQTTEGGKRRNRRKTKEKEVIFLQGNSSRLLTDYDVPSTYNMEVRYNLSLNTKCSCMEGGREGKRH